MSIKVVPFRVVAEAPKEYEGTSRDADGAFVLHETLTNLGWKVEIVRHGDTFYVVNK